MAKGRSGGQLGEIATALGLSVSTVSIVLNGRGDEMRISKETQERIRQTAQGMNYQPNIYARRLRKMQEGSYPMSIGIFWCSHYSDETMGHFFHGAFEGLKGENKQVEFALHIFPSGRLCDMKELLTSNYFNGMIVNGASDSDVEFLSAQELCVPLVLAGRSAAGVSCVYVDNYALGKKCAQLFAANGHKEVGIIGCERRSAGSSLRLTGFLDACREHDITVREEWRLPTVTLDISGGYTATQQLLTQKKQPTGLFIMTDLEATGAVLYLKEHNLMKKPEYAIVVYGYNKTLATMAPDISYARIMIEDIARQSMELLQTLLKNQFPGPVNQMTNPEIHCGQLKRIEHDG